MTDEVIDVTILDPPKVEPRMPEQGDKHCHYGIIRRVDAVPEVNRWVVAMGVDAVLCRAPGALLRPMVEEAGEWTTHDGAPLLDVWPDLPTPAIEVDPEPVAWMVERGDRLGAGMFLARERAVDVAEASGRSVVPLYRRATP